MLLLLFFRVFINPLCHTENVIALHLELILALFFVFLFPVSLSAEKKDYLMLL